ncbi:MAG: prolipoprotein diacylglyceryl transferase [Defluviitaleaceae bacterium]|nr:prolipoprotein diacylglyceryl transferase [Defluviitaleaceae bacterium]MCL2240103.1 prolipoprotein diacylglyceryl transferase [Defluviitaleaceae bacterium]
MLPYLSFPGRTYPTYVVLGLVGFFAAVLLAGFRTKRYGLPRADALYIGLFAGIGLLIGGVLLFALTQLRFGGMVFYGGLFGAVGGIFLYSRFMKLPFGTAMKLAVPVFPLAHAIMRLGCFAGGCCYGIAHPPPLGIAFTQSLAAPNNVPLLPVQLYEAAVNLFIFAILWLFTKKERHWIVPVCLYGLLYSFARFWLEFLRGDEIRGFIMGLSTSQFISVLIFPLCVAGLCKRAVNTLNHGRILGRDGGG